MTLAIVIALSVIVITYLISLLSKSNKQLNLQQKSILVLEEKNKELQKDVYKMSDGFTQLSKTDEIVKAKLQEKIELLKHLEKQMFSLSENNIQLRENTNKESDKITALLESHVNLEIQLEEKIKLSTDIESKIKIHIENRTAMQNKIYEQSDRITETAKKNVELESENNRLTSELTALQSELTKYSSILEQEAYLSTLKDNEIDLLSSLGELQNSKQLLEDTIITLKAELPALELDKISHEFGLYEPKYNFENSTIYKIEMDDIRLKQKMLIKNGLAVECDVEWSVQGSSRRGRQMVNQIMRLMTWAFNSEVESLILRAKFDNFNSIRERIFALFERVNKLDAETSTHITSDFLLMKIKELEIYHEYQDKKQLELEEQREIRDRMREEEKAQRELEKVQADALKEEQRYTLALERARSEINSAIGERQVSLEKEINKLSQALAEAQSRRERALSMAEQTRIGHVYVISNVGSFGENIYKIGMTRRLEPLERIRELSNASVPFRFDVHAIIYSQDAPNLESQLHKAFSHRRVNKVNPQKEFFSVSLEEIRDFVWQHHGEIQFTLAAEAADYRKTKAMRA